MTTGTFLFTKRALSESMHRVVNQSLIPPNYDVNMPPYPSPASYIVRIMQRNRAEMCNKKSYRNDKSYNTSKLFLFSWRVLRHKCIQILLILCFSILILLCCISISQVEDNHPRRCLFFCVIWSFIGLFLLHWVAHTELWITEKFNHVFYVPLPRLMI